VVPVASERGRGKCGDEQGRHRDFGLREHVDLRLFDRAGRRAVLATATQMGEFNQFDNGESKQRTLQWDCMNLKRPRCDMSSAMTSRQGDCAMCAIR
jgi:hypothetical protein